MYKTIATAALAAVLATHAASAESKLCPVVYSSELRTQIVERAVEKTAWLSDAYDTSSPDITQDGRSIIGKAGQQRPGADIWITVKPYGPFDDESIVIVADACDLERVTNKTAFPLLSMCPQQPNRVDDAGRTHYYPPGSWCVKVTDVVR